MPNTDAPRRRYYTDRAFVFSAVLAGTLFLGSMVATWIAGTYATTHASNHVADIILSNTPVFNLSGVFIWGAVLLTAFVAVLLTIDPKRIPFTLLSLALFFFIRAAFITFTHLGPFPERDVTDSVIATRFLFGSDSFFSGHTGAPFLLALLFWHKSALRYVFLAVSIMFGVVVLLAHLHYTIDVASAFFITYSIFHLAEVFFPNARRLFHEGLPTGSH